MNTRLLAALIGGLLSQAFAAGVLSYLGGYSGGVSLIGAEFGGYAAGICAAIAIFRKPEKTLAGLALTIIVAGFFSRPITIPLFASGFKNRALEKASIKDWEGLLSLKDRLMSVRTGDRASMLPEFVRNVHRGGWIYCADISEDPDSEMPQAFRIWWRGPDICVGFDIGKTQPPDGRFLFNQKLSEQLVLVVFAGG